MEELTLPEVENLTWVDPSYPSFPNEDSKSHPRLWHGVLGCEKCNNPSFFLQWNGRGGLVGCCTKCYTFRTVASE